MAAVRPATPFIGRRPQLSRLTDLLEGARSGRAAGVLLAGDAGVGKTSVVGELSRRAADAGMLVLVGRCVDLGSGGLPYLPFAEALSGLVRAGDAAGPGPEREAAAAVRAAAEHRPGLGRLAGGAGDLPSDRAPGDAGLDRLALFESLAGLLAELSRDVAPVLLVVEDLHWADSSTRDLLRFLLARLDGDRLLAVATYRTDDLHRRHPLRPLLAELVRLPAVERVELSPFAPAELAEFLAAVQGSAVPGAVVDEIAERSAGNAYFAEELLAAGPAERLPTALADVLLDRMERLAPDTQALVRVASVVGASRIDDRLLRAVAAGTASVAGPALDDALREAITHHALVPDGPERWAFRHALLQEAVYTDLLPGERVRLHAAAAAEVARDGAASAGEQARHAIAAHDLPQALDASLRAAAEARRRLAPAEALDHYEQVLQLWHAVLGDGAAGTGEDVIEVGLAAADAAGDAGRHDRAADLARTALEQAERAGDRRRTAAVRSRLALHLYANERDIVVARDEARRAVADLPGEPTPERVRAWAIEARVDVSLNEPEAADAIVGTALAEARALGLRSTEADLLISLSSIEAQLGRPDFERHVVEARRVATEAGDWATVLRTYYNIALNRYEEGNAPAAIAAVDDAVEMAHRSGLDGSLYATQCRWLQVTLRWAVGDPEGALAAVEDGRRSLPPMQAAAMALAGLQVVVARDPERALELTRTQQDEWAWDVATRLALRAEALVWLGRPAEAVERAREALQRLEGTGEPYTLAGIWMAVTRLSAAADLAADGRRGDRDALAAATAAAELFAGDGRARAVKGAPRMHEIGPEGRAWLARLEAEALRLAGEPAAGAWRATVEAFGYGAVYEQARCRRRLAEELLRDGDRDGALAEAAAAHEVAVRLGARPLREAVEDFARRARLPLGGAPAAAGGGLTPRERDVMRLVAQGLTNRQIGERLFISEKTASVHVSNVLAKLGASGRAEAVAVVSRRGLLDD